MCMRYNYKHHFQVSEQVRLVDKPCGRAFV